MERETMNVVLRCKDCGQEPHRNENPTMWYEYSLQLNRCVLTNIPSHQMVMNQCAGCRSYKQYIDLLEREIQRYQNIPDKLDKEYWRLKQENPELKAQICGLQQQLKREVIK